MTYYISDLHFGHTNILSFDDRPFFDVASHDKALIERWNDTVSPSDTVWILGDISWYGPEKTAEILDSMTGTKNLCTGNHDERLMRSSIVRSRFAEITSYKEIRGDDGSGIVLCHYPIPCFKNHYYNWIHLYGHVHNTFEWNITEHTKREMTELYGKPCRMFNVGCMMTYMDYTPKTLAQIIEAQEGEGKNPAENKKASCANA